jgi:two-component system, cell cycle sensor histidine kinase and response regulator CckA
MEIHNRPSCSESQHPRDWVSRPCSLVFTGIFSFILIFGIAVFLAYRQIETTRHNSLTADATTANLLAKLIFEHNKATTGILQSYALRPGFIKAVKNTDPEATYTFLSDLKKNSEIDLTFVTDKRGILLTTFPLFPETLGKDLSYRDWYKGVSSQWRPFISTVFKLIIENKPLAVAICVPISDEKGNIIGILATSQRLDFLANTIENVPLSPRTTVNVIDRAGQILYSNKLPYLENITDYRSLQYFEEEIKRGGQQIEINDPQNGEGKNHLTVVPIGNIGWTVIVERSQRDIFHSESRSFVEIGAISLLFFVSVNFFLVYLKKVTLFRRTEELLKAETKLRQGDEELRTLASRQEAILAAVPEIIMEVDINKVYTWANTVGIEFFGEDVIGKEAAFYFEGEQDTYDTINPLFNGSEEIIYVESWQRRRDGEKRLLAWWCRVLKNKDGKAEGVISSAHDITERKQVEEALLESENTFRAMVEKIPLAIYLSVGIEQRATYINPEFIKLFGYTLEDIPTVEKWWPLAYPDEHYRTEISAKWNQRVQQAIETQSSIEPIEVVVTCKDGSKKNISWGYITLGDKNYAFGLDLTRRKQAEEEQRKIAERLSLACRAGGIGIWEWDVDTDHLIWDEPTRLLFGITPDMFSHTSETWRARVHPDDLQRCEEEVQLALYGEKDFDTEFRIVRPDGVIRSIRASAITQKEDSTGQVIKLIGTHYDITQRKMADMERERLLHILESSLNEIYVFDSISLVFEYVNRAALKNLGYPYEAILSRMTPVDLKPEFTETTFRQFLEPLLQGTQEKLHFETVHRRHDGSLYPVEVHLQLVKIEDQHVFLAVILDTSARKQAEKDREGLEAQLRQAQKMESVGRLAGGVAHDFNNMLSVILGYGNMVLERTKPDDFLHECAQEIINAGSRSVNITRQLLAFARKQTISPQVLDLNETIQDMLKMLGRLIGEDIHLSWRPASIWPVNIDPSQLDQILANICVNARDSISGVGTIIIETGTAILDEAYCLKHPGFAPGRFVLLSINDDGCGMDEDVQRNLFEPFFTTKELGKGTGLGLATVYGIVKQNQGFINVSSEPGKGTTFRIYLPRHDEQGNKPEKTSVESIQRGRGETVLVVEDEASILRFTSRTLKDLGYTVVTANSPAEAVSLAQKGNEKIDLLITDVIMPEMNGRDLANVLLSIVPDLKCLFMSGYPSTVIAGQGVLAEGVHFLQKPFSARDLAAKARETLAA